MLTTQYTTLPPSLRARPQWVAWRAVPYTTKEGKSKINKIPINPKTGHEAKANDFTTWGTDHEAITHAQANNLAGVGFVFCEADDYTGIDFDNCLNAEGQLHPEVEGYLQRLNSYSEVSPSGTGIKIIVRGKFPLTAGHKIEKTGYAAEFYNTKRYFTITGHRLPAYPGDVTTSPSAAVIYTEIFGKAVVSTKPANPGVGLSATPTEEAERIRKALEFIPPDDYETWLHMGFALKWWAGQGGGEGAQSIWNAWSAKSDKFNQQTNDYQWGHFDASGPIGIDSETGLQTHRAITLGTLFKLAQKNGWSDTTLPMVVLPPGGGTINSVGVKLGELLAATGGIFVRGGVVVERGQDERGERILKPVIAARAPSLFEEVAALKKKEKQETVPAICPKSTAEVLLNSQRFLETLPPIKLITPCPVLVVRADGTLHEIVSYDKDSGVLAGGTATTVCTLEEAIALLQLVVVDFDFVSQGDHARAVAALITPAMVFGGLLTGRAPVDVTEANVSQSGKGYRNKLTAAIYGLAVATVNKKTAGGVGSMEESFDTHLVNGKPFISFDNIRGVLDSQKMESFCTEDSYSARIPHCQAVSIDPRRTILMITSNKAEMPVDLVNRSSIVRIQKRLDTYQYRKYPEGDILAHVRANQGRFLGAIHTILKEWFKEGCPRTEVRQHDFANWGGSLDWIVQHLLGSAPLLDDHANVQQRVTNPYLTWLRDVALAVFDANQDNKPLTANQVIDVLERYKPAALAEFLKPGDNLMDEETRSRVLKAIGKRLGTFFNLDQCCIDVDVHSVCREEVTVEKSTGEGTRKSKRYTFSRIPGIPDAAPPSTPNPPPMERSKPPITPNAPDDSIILSKENINSHSIYSNSQIHGGVGGGQGLHGGISPSHQRRKLPYGGGRINPSPPKAIIERFCTTQEFILHCLTDPIPPEPSENGAE